MSVRVVGLCLEEHIWMWEDGCGMRKSAHPTSVPADYQLSLSQAAADDELPTAGCLGEIGDILLA